MSDSPIVQAGFRQLCWLGVGVCVATCWFGLSYIIPVFASLMGLLAGVLLAVYVLIWPVDLLERALIWLVSFGYRASLSSDLSSRAPRQFSRLIRGAAIVLVFILFLALVLWLLIWGVPILLRQIQQVIHGAPGYAEQFENMLLDLFARWGILDWEPVQTILLQGANEDSAHSLFLVQPVSDWLTEQGDWVGGALASSFKNAFELVTSTLQRAFYVWLAIPLVFFALMDGGRIRWVVKRFFKEGSFAQQHADFVLCRAHDVMLAFLRGQVMLGFITGAYMFFIYQWFGVKFALLLSVIFFVAEIIPVVGTWIGIIPGLLAAYMSGGLSVAFWVWLCSYSYQTIKDNIVAPKVVGDVMGLHPLVVLISILMFTRMFGLVGTIFAIPITALAYSVWQYLIAQWEPEFDQGLSDQRVVSLSEGNV